VASPPEDAEPPYRDPVWLIRCEWSRLRLPVLQRLVAGVIVDLCEPVGAGGEPGAVASDGMPDPRAAALQACRAELRDACALDGADAELVRARELIRGQAAASSPDWLLAFESGLRGYRRAASEALSASLLRGAAVE
jgi:hypothetical protein